MELTPEERRRIYEEERDRLAAEDGVAMEEAPSLDEAARSIGVHPAYILMAVMVTGFFAWVFYSESTVSPEVKRYREEMTARQSRYPAVFQASQAYIKQRLKAPSTAEFPWYDSSAVSGPDGNVYTVRSYVDSENGFGAKIRTNYAVKLREDSNGDIQLVDIQMRN